VKTRILLTIGDFNGIGPEIILKALSSKAIVKKYDLTVISPVSVIEFYSKRLGRKFYAGDFNLIPIGRGNIKINPGRTSDTAGFISGIAIVKAIKLCMAGEFDAVVTAPVSKESLNLGGFVYDGHTDMLREFSNAKDVCMMMAFGKLKIALATTHPPLKSVPKIIDRNLLSRKMNTCFLSLKNDFKISRPKIGVLGLNPHSGDGGVIGNEEIKVINPVLKNLNRKLRKNIFYGSFAADAYFASGAYKKYELTFAMYHDQGLIPFKLIAGFKGINYTAGLKFIRTSPDHGTAFDIAGKNKADPVSFIEAIKWADKIYRLKNR
jgi:4-hydroxythreonine-4-phosphate dehydrogenase